MKKLLPTLILVVVCIAGFWYASSKDFFREKKDEPVPLITVKKEDVQSFTIKNNEADSGDGALVVLENKDGQWTMTKPASYPLNSYSTDSWLGAISQTTGEKKVEDNAADLSKYGLDKPKQEFQVTLKDGTQKSLLVGEETPIPGFYFVKTGDSNAVYQESQDQINSLKKGPLDFLEKSPFQFEYNKLKSLNVEWKGNQWTLTKSDPSKMGYESNWRLGSLDLKPEDGSSFLDKLINISTDRMVKPASEVKMDGAELRVSIVEDKDGKDSPSTYLGKIDGNDVWIAKQGGDWAYAISLSSVEELYNKADDTKKKVEEQNKQGDAAQQGGSAGGSDQANKQ